MHIEDAMADHQAESGSFILRREEGLEQQVEGRHELAMRSAELAELARAVREGQRRVVAAIVGVGAVLVVAVLYALR